MEVPLADPVEDADVAVNVTPYIIGFNENLIKKGDIYDIPLPHRVPEKPVQPL